MIYVYWGIIIVSIAGIYAAITTLIKLNKIKQEQKHEYLNNVSEDIKKIKHPIFKK